MEDLCILACLCLMEEASEGIQTNIHTRRGSEEAMIHSYQENIMYEYNI